MSYLNTSKTQGVRRGSPMTDRFAGIPFIFCSKNGSKGSNSGKKEDSWWNRYQRKNANRRRNK